MDAATTALGEDGSGEAKPRRSRVGAIERMLQILDQLRDTGRPATAYDLAQSLKAPLSTVYTIVDDLAEKGILIRGEGGTVWLGPRLYHYGLAYERSIDLMAVAKEEMLELNRDLRETIQICGRDDDMMVVLAMAEGEDHFQVTSRVGSRVPLNWVASGRLLVGHLAEEERIAIFRRAAKASPTGRAELNPETLSRQAAAAFAERLSIQAGESAYSVACVAAPVLDRGGACAATVSVVLPDFKVGQARERYAEAVRRSAGQIEARLGWRRAG
ncbi:IclR family transcriptional regulator [Aureimonas leprariae]|uniref:IclR family transcriptional regulator n=1 Tax=Plantimonas leprariae TaxID=2615207 RepID=A0A7V7PLH1_9HYPH|nr:IclR family transcriptional regulator [Aureimonas leprariae]KAB0677220.1 IclR family transcriptional regulator [Aureimonas leprariae]